MARRGVRLSDAQWAKIEPHLPRLPRSARGGRAWIGHRAVIDGILWVLKTGARWRDLPGEYPSPATCWRRLKRWDEDGTWERIWRAFLAELDARGRLAFCRSEGHPGRSWSRLRRDRRPAPAIANLSALRGRRAAETNRRIMHVPPGCAHGYQTPVDDTEVFYFVSAPYSPNHQRGVRWDDPAFGVAWPLGPPTRIHERDASHPDFERVKPDVEVVVADNRKAGHDYHFLETLEAGLVLTGTDVKAAREGRVNLWESYCRLEGAEAYLLGAHFGQYGHGGYAAHDPVRKQKLLLNRAELNRLLGKTTEKGLTIVPIRIKLAIALAKSKKSFDKRETIRRREIDRETRAAVKSRRLQSTGVECDSNDCNVLHRHHRSASGPRCAIRTDPG